MPEVSDEGAFEAIVTPTSVDYVKKPEPDKTGQAYVETPRAKTTRELEMKAGKRRVEEAQRMNANRPPRVISEAERRAQGFNVEVFRPNTVYADRVTSVNGSPVNQQLGALMRKVGGSKPN
eukprot:GHVR01071767.1.p3 GENE.GHVR01071767.1~~GHVR01071767.1.p3  ORF type:complete len:121 (-),score=10.58 GHVR01071767.1:1074-1436(-)